MNKYTSKLKEFSANFSYYQFIELLKEIDTDILNGNVGYFDGEFIHYFKQIINLVNDNYIVEGKPGSLGHMLVENALLKKERLTPTLAMCFILEQKKNIGLDDVCNEIIFSHLKSDDYRMMITDYHNTGHSNLSINIGQYSREPKENADEYNYDMMTDILHELIHVYQLTRTEQSESLFDRLTYYDYQTDGILIRNGGNNGNPLFHQALLSEFMADEQANVFMLQLAKKYPEYFNDELIHKKQLSYQNKKNGTYGDYGTNPRKVFAKLISDIQLIGRREPSLTFIKSMLDEIEVLSKKKQPIIEELESQGFSEKGTDMYYNVFLNSFYRFNGKEIIISEETPQILLNQEENVTFDSVKEKLNRLLYEISDLSNASNISKENKDFLLDRVEMIQILMGYLTGSSYEKIEIEGKAEYIKLAPIDPKIIYDAANREIDFINDRLGIKEIDGPVLSDEEKEKQRQEFETALQKALEDGVKNYYDELASKPTIEDIAAVIDIQFRDITPSDITTKSGKNVLGDVVEKKQITLSRELAKILNCEYLFEPPLHEGHELPITVLEQVTIHGKDTSTTSYRCSRYNTMEKNRGGIEIRDESIINLIESRFQQIMQIGTIQPSAAAKSALKETSSTKANEAKSVEQTALNPENIKEGEIKDD